MLSSLTKLTNFKCIPVIFHHIYCVFQWYSEWFRPKKLLNKLCSEGCLYTGYLWKTFILIKSIFMHNTNKKINASSPYFLCTFWCRMKNMQSSIGFYIVWFVETCLHHVDYFGINGKIVSITNEVLRWFLLDGREIK